MGNGRIKQILLKLISLTAVIAVMVATVPSTATLGAVQPKTNAEKIDALKQEQNRIKAETKKVESDLSKEKEKQLGYASEIENIKQQLDLYQQEIDKTEAQISTQKEQIAQTDRDIASKNIEIGEKENDIALTDIKFQQRIEAMYMAGNTSSLNILLGSASFSDFLSRTELINSISKNDQELIKKLAGQKKELEQLKIDLQTKMTSLETTKADLENQKQNSLTARAEFKGKSDELNALYVKSRGTADSLQNNKENLDKRYEENDAEQDAIEKLLQAELDKLKKEQEQQQSSKPSGGESSQGDSNQGDSNQGDSSQGDGGQGGSSSPTTPDGGGSSGGSSENTTPTPPPPASSTRYIWPLPGAGYVSSPYGPRKLGGNDFHYGMDIAAPEGTAIVASKAGVIVRRQEITTGYGKNIIINHEDGTFTLYAHCSQLLVNQGQRVKQGQLIARVGNTGDSYGNHCHFEIRMGASKYDAVDPAKYVSR